MAKGFGAAGGAYRGMVVFLNSDIEFWADRLAHYKAQHGDDSVDGLLFVVQSPSNRDIERMLKIDHLARGWIIEQGGRTSHASLMANIHGISAVVGVNGLEVDEKSRNARIISDLGILRDNIREGEIYSVDGARDAGRIYSGSVPLSPMPVSGSRSSSELLHAA